MNMLKTIVKGVVETAQRHRFAVGVGTTLLTIVGIKGVFAGIGSMIGGYVSDGTDNE